MKDTFRKIVKAGAIWFAAGALFALGANMAAPMLGGEFAALAQAISPVWLGTMMAGATMIATALEPLSRMIFGEESPQNPAVIVRDNDGAKQVNITVVQSPQQSQQVALNANHRQAIEMQRLENRVVEKDIIPGCERLKNLARCVN